MHKGLFEEFRRFEGQPVIVETTDCRKHHGIVLDSCEDGARILDECCRLEFIDYCHIAGVIEPQMSLHKCKHGHHEHHGHHGHHGHEDDCCNCCEDCCGDD